MPGALSGYYNVMECGGGGRLDRGGSLLSAKAKVGKHDRRQGNEQTREKDRDRGD